LIKNRWSSVLKGARPRVFPLFSSRNIAIARKLVRNCGGGSPLVHERLHGIVDFD
jgi:hypothetical protein